MKENNIILNLETIRCGLEQHIKKEGVDLLQLQFFLNSVLTNEILQGKKIDCVHINKNGGYGFLYMDTE